MARSDKDLLDWLRTDLAAALEWHGAQAKRTWLDPANQAAEQAKANMICTIQQRLDAYEAGQKPIHPKARAAPPSSNPKEPSA